MLFPHHVRIALLGATAFGLWCAPGDAQQTPKRQPGTAAAEKSTKEKSSRENSTARPPAGNSPASRPANVRQAGATEEAPKKRRPQAPELHIEPLAPELEQLLKEWERESAKVKTLSGKHERIVYNSVFEVQKIANGQFFYESPDKGRIDLVGIEPKPGEKGKRQSEKTGQPYRVEKEQPTKWICNGKDVLNINEEEKTVETFPLPPELQGKNIIHGPLPFLFGMKAEEAKMRFELSFADEADPKKNNEKVVWIVAKPRQVMDHENFQEATIILDRKRFLPLAVRLLDPSGNLETVYTFPSKELHVNQKALLPEIFRKKPFEPDLANYKKIKSSDEMQADDGKRSDNGGRTRAPIRQTNAEGEDAPGKSTPRPRTAAPGTRPAASAKSKK